MRTLLVQPPLLPGLLEITGDEAHHGRSVLRLRPNDDVRIADGAGRTASARIQAIDRQTMSVLVDEVRLEAPLLASFITVACAVPKGDRFGDLVRQLTELGVGAIQPLICERGERIPANLERSRRIAAEALKQCRRAFLPEIGPVVDIPTLAGCGKTLIMLDPLGAAAEPGPPAPVVFVIGPEGGFTALETATLRQARAVPVRLASTILRIETAALAATAVWVSKWEARD